MLPKLHLDAALRGSSPWGMTIAPASPRRAFARGLAAALLASAFIVAPAIARPLTPMDMVMMKRVGAPAVSPDGRWLAYQLRSTDLAANRGRTDLYLLDLKAKGAKATLVASAPDKNESAPAFAADGASLYYLSDASGDDQLWKVALDKAGMAGTPVQVTAAHGGISGFKLSPAGDKVALWADRPVGAKTLADVAPAKAENAGSGRVYDKLFVRHWDTWADGQRSALFVQSLSAGSDPHGAVSVMGPLIGDTPSKPFGGAEELSWSPDGRTLYFALRDGSGNEAKSTNLDIWSVPADASAAPTNLTPANQATDTLPAVSPDGKWLAWAAMKVPGYESDRQVLMLHNIASGEVKALTKGWDRSVASIAWAADGKSLLVTAMDTLDEPMFRVDAASGKVTRLTRLGYAGNVVPLPGGGAVYTLNSIQAPDDLWRMDGKGKASRLTAVNADLLADIDDVDYQRFSFKGANGDTVWAQIVKPLNPTASGTPDKLPVAFLVHGGPQGSFGDGWSYRWNPKVFAAHGYAAVTVDFHGSTGYGQAFTDAINRDWGGKPLEDLKLGFAAAGAKDAALDLDNACALGASYGGYMMNWIAGKWNDRFKCIVNHDGIFDLRAMAFETEELWFDQHDNGGNWWTRPDAEKWNPANYAKDWRIPALIIHSEKDFRIPVTQGIAAFTALQEKGIPSKLLVFPDENHWVLKAKNSLQWHGEVFGWLDRWLRPGK